MKTYTVIYAEDVPHYAHGEIEARGPKDAIAKARKIDTETFTAYDPDWSGAVCSRIVSIEDHHGNVVAQDISLDNYVLHHADADKRLKLDAAEAMFEALCAQEMAEFDPEASDRKGYFTIARELRKTALAKAGGTEMNRLFDQMLNGITCDDCIGDGVANLPDDANHPLYNSAQLQVAFHFLSSFLWPLFVRAQSAGRAFRVPTRGSCFPVSVPDPPERQRTLGHAQAMRPAFSPPSTTTNKRKSHE